ncbi:MAG: XRE family transcriptional regulator [Candidatus Lernaella stagnicola]|nr:XRE family transcriptional regulator [Candidatus Lernaella stagnicola]
MARESEIEIRMKDPDYAKLYFEEGLVIDVLEEICALMKKKNISRAELAGRLNTTRANVTQMLNGRNVQLRTLAGVVYALEGDIQIRVKERRATPVGDHNPMGEIVQLQHWAAGPSRMEVFVHCQPEPNRGEAGDFESRKVAG